jgi:hypothetical protein
MAMRELPVQASVRDQEFQVTLEGRLYTLRLAWNIRAEAWFLSVYDSAGSAVLEGKKVVADWDLLRTVVDSRRPPGQLLALDLEGTGEAPGLAELGERVILVYAEAG